MFGVEANFSPIWLQSSTSISKNCISKTRICLPGSLSNRNLVLGKARSSSVSSQFSLCKYSRTRTHFSLKASSTSGMFSLRKFKYFDYERSNKQEILEIYSQFIFLHSILMIERLNGVFERNLFWHCYLAYGNLRYGHKQNKKNFGSAEYTEEPATKVKFQTTLSLPGCSSSLSLLGTGFREKVFAIVGVKVYAAGLYVNPSVLSELNSWKERSATKIQEDLSLFRSVFQAPLEKSLQIVLVRDVDGKTFWNALDDAISPRIKSPTPADESALSTFRSIFQERPLKKGSFIFLTWLDTSKMIVSVSSNRLPSSVDATIESANVTSSLFDVFFGDAPVCPSLKASVADGFANVLK